MDRIAIAAVMKQEQPYIVEWVAWHRLLGFDILIADHGGTDGQTELLLKLEAAGLISRIDVRHFRLRPQLFAYHALFRRAQRNGARYLGFLDADEFFEPLDGSTPHNAGARIVRRLFEETGAMALGFNWMCFGSSLLEAPSPEPVMQRFTLAASQDFAPNRHFKSFCDVPRCQRELGCGLFGAVVIAPHGFKVGASNMSHDGQAFEEAESFSVTKAVSWKHARIRHYVTKTFAEYLRGKTARGHADGRLSSIHYDRDFYELHDRNEVLAPVGADALRLLLGAIGDINQRIDAITLPAGAVASPGVWSRWRTYWEARPTMALVKDKLSAASTTSAPKAM